MINKKLIYSLVEKITFGRGLPKTLSGIKLRLPVRYIRYFPPDYESENFSFLKSVGKEGAVVLDIGAHIGLFAVISAKIGGPRAKVFAFEPAPDTYKILNQTIGMNHLDEVITPVNQAMGKEVGNIDFFISDIEGDNSNSLVQYKSDRKINKVEVAVNTIDNFVASKDLSKIDFIKIDVEGAEYDTLLGGIEVFKRFKPACILAIHPEPIAKKGDKLEDIYDLLQQLNYHISYRNKSISKQEFCNNTDMIDLHLLPAEAGS